MALGFIVAGIVLCVALVVGLLGYLMDRTVRNDSTGSR